MGKDILVAWSKNKAGAQLEWVLPHFVLPMTSRLGFLTCSEVVLQEKMEEIGCLEVSGFVGQTLFVDQQGESDFRFFSEAPGVVDIPKTDGGEGGTCCV